MKSKQSCVGYIYVHVCVGGGEAVEDLKHDLSEQLTVIKMSLLNICVVCIRRILDLKGEILQVP